MGVDISWSRQRITDMNRGLHGRENHALVHKVSEASTVIIVIHFQKTIRMFMENINRFMEGYLLTPV